MERKPVCNRREHDNEISEIVKSAVHETLTALGFTIDDPNAVQQDMAYLRKSRMGADDVAKWVKRSGISVAITAFFTVVWMGIQAAMELKGH